MKRAAILCAALVLGAAPAYAATALVGGTVHTVSGDVIENGTVIMDGGKILAVGAGAAIPTGARQIDVTGLHVYPGMIAANTVLGLVEVSSVKGPDDVSEGGTLNPNARAMVALNADSELIPVTRANGILTVLSVNTGGVLSGTSVVWNLQGWNWEEMTLVPDEAVHLRWPSMVAAQNPWDENPKSEEDQKKEREEKLKGLKDAFANAKAYAKAQEAAAAGGPPHEKDVRWEAMMPALKGDMPVFIHADEYTQIEMALDFAKEQEIKIVIVGGRDAPFLADRLAAENVPVIIDGVLDLPTRSWEPYDEAYSVAARLHEAGVKFCISTGGNAFGVPNLRNLPYEAGMAAAFGLPKDEALKSVTLYPAQILGIDDRLGSIDAGKDANLIVTTGDPIEITSNVLMAWIEGEPVDLGTRHTDLYDKYRNRPRRDGKETQLQPSPATGR